MKAGFVCFIEPGGANQSQQDVAIPDCVFQDFNIIRAGLDLPIKENILGPKPLGEFVFDKLRDDRHIGPAVIYKDALFHFALRGLKGFSVKSSMFLPLYIGLSRARAPKRHSQEIVFLSSWLRLASFDSCLRGQYPDELRWFQADSEIEQAERISSGENLFADCVNSGVQDLCIPAYNPDLLMVGRTI